MYSHYNCPELQKVLTKFMLLQIAANALKANTINNKMPFKLISGMEFLNVSQMESR